MTEAEAKADAEDFFTVLETVGATIPPAKRLEAVSFLTSKLLRCSEQGAVDAIDDVLARIGSTPAPRSRPRRR